MSLSIIIPTFNESHNILKMLDSIVEVLAPEGAEIIVVDDNSPDGTGRIAQEYSGTIEEKGFSLQIIHRPARLGLSSAIIAGVQSATGEIMVVMDSDFSHSPQTIPSMVGELRDSKYDIVIASRYMKGGSVVGWPFKRRLMSMGATKIAQYGLKIKVKDPMSGFFAFKRDIIDGVEFDALGYKLLLEILVKTKGARVKEIPYTFTDRKSGQSKLNASVMYDYMKSVWKLYRYGREAREKESRTSVRFLSKAGRFYTVGATGLLVNFVVSFLFSSMLPELWYLHATVLGIAFSITSNFILNKLWTFEDLDFDAKKTLGQYGLFICFSALGVLLQLSLVYLLVESYQMSYPLALVLAVAAASIGNFLLNKKWTFKERIWS